MRARVTLPTERLAIATVPVVNDVDFVEILDLDRTLVLTVLAIGFAMVAGNGFAVWQHHRGNKPKGEEGEFRPTLAYWLIAVGLIMMTWGLLSF
jgi:hypothetical protein